MSATDTPQWKPCPYCLIPFEPNPLFDVFHRGRWWHGNCYSDNLCFGAR